MSIDIFAGFVGVVVSLAFSYVPQLRQWFESLDEKFGDELGGNYKRLVMLGFAAATAAGVVGLACIGRYSGVTCDQNGVWEMLRVFVAFAVMNQTAFSLAPRRN